MKYLSVTHKESGKIIGKRVGFANSLLSRIFGLMFKADLGEMDGLMIQPCNSIHTFFMRFSIDVVFLSANGEIVKILRSMKPWRMSWMYFRAVKTLELKSGTLPIEIQEGSHLEVAHV